MKLPPKVIFKPSPNLVRSQKRSGTAVSTDRRNTLFFLERWSVIHGLSEAGIFNDKQKAEIWDRWQRGESMSSIGRQFDRASSSIYPLLERTGGIRPAAQRRSRLALTLNEREEISRGLTAQHSLRSIARSLRRSPSTVSREVKRNGCAKHYRAEASDLSAWTRAHRPKPANWSATTISAVQSQPS